MYKFYECDVCGNESKLLHGTCNQCHVGDMIKMTVIKSDVLKKLYLELSYLKEPKKCTCEKCTGIKTESLYEALDTE